MIYLEHVLSDYFNTKELFQNKVPSNSNTQTTISLDAIRNKIPAEFIKFIKSKGLDQKDFKVYGSIGQKNLNMASVPWVAICKKSITESATNGYYIVALFSEDMSSVTLSLNQGYTAFKQRYGINRVAYKKLEDCALAARSKIPSFPDFHFGPIDLCAKGELAKGYQAGSIMSKTYTSGNIPKSQDVESDVHALLGAYLILANSYPESLVDLDVSISEIDFQESAEDFSFDKIDGYIKPGTSGPQPKPKKGEYNGKGKYPRSPSIAGRALRIAKYRCAFATIEDSHHSFISKKTEKTYVEAHHLVPFSYQEYFPYSLDVEENIVVLCPNCHKKLHHGTAMEKNQPLKKILGERVELLKARGIAVTFEKLKVMYKSLSEDD